MRECRANSDNELQPTRLGADGHLDKRWKRKLKWGGSFTCATGQDRTRN